MTQDVKIEIPFSVGKLRPWREGDQPSLVENLNNVRVWENLLDVVASPYERLNADLWVRELCRAPGEINLAIEIAGQAVGGFGFKRLQPNETGPEVGYWLGEAFWGRGIMSDVVRSAANWAFRERDFMRLSAGIFGYNQRSRRVLEKVGFKHEGTFRQAIRKGGRITDLIFFGLCRDDVG